MTPARTQQSPAPAQTDPAQATPGAPTLHLQDLPPDPHTPTPAEAEQQRQQAALNAAMRLASMEAGWGPSMDSPGLSIALAEVKRTKTPGGSTQITYQITGSGFAPDEKLLLVRWPLNSEAQTMMGGISFDAKGIAVCTAPAPAQATLPPATATPQGTARGYGSGRWIERRPRPESGQHAGGERASSELHGDDAAATACGSGGDGGVWRGDSGGGDERGPEARRGEQRDSVPHR